MKKNKPNIIFILNDHQAYYRHGWDGGPKVMRPNFEALASGGVDFTHASSVCPLCGPARRTMLTGLYPHNHGEIRNDTNMPFSDKEEVYLDILGQNGYKNYYYGKWHAGPGTALDHHCEGFNFPSYNNPYTKDAYKAYLKKYNLPEPMIEIKKDFCREALGFDTLVEGEDYIQDASFCNEHAVGLMKAPRECHEAFFLADMACDKLKELADADSDEPFHLRVDFWGPHQPYFVTQDYLDLYDPKAIPTYGNFKDDLKNKPDRYKRENNKGLGKDFRLIQPSALPWNEWQQVLAYCYAQITLVDDAAGLIMKALEETGLADNTIVIYTTDHGDAVACHGGHFDKASYLPEELMRIPMAMRYPGVIEPGRTVDSFVSNLDIAPTILDAAGLSFTNKVDGKSLLNICGDVGEERQSFMCESYGHGQEEVMIGRVLYWDKYKYIYNDKEMDELYNLEEDPFELTNRIYNEDDRELLHSMKQKLIDQQTISNDPEKITLS